MDRFELLQRFSVALAIGLLIGIERGWQARGEREGERAAGLRTHALAAVLGALWGGVARDLGEGGGVALGLAFVSFSAAITLFRFRETAHDGTFGATTLVAAMVAFALGAYAMTGDMQVAGACGVAVTALLALKSALHAWVRGLTWVELRSGLLLLAMTVILLPLLPNQTIDPWASINPFELWLMTVMIAVISFTGYVAMKMLGTWGGGVITGIAGGLVSSMAVTVTMARLAGENPERRGPFLAAAVLAGATMMARVLGIVGVVSAGLLAHLVLPIGFAGIALAAGAMLLLRTGARTADSDGPMPLKNPFELATVLKFGALLTVISALSHIVTGKAGDAGVYTLAALSGIADVDAITLSMARLSAGPLRPEVAARAILIVVVVNTFSKAVLGWVTGGYEAGWRLLAAAAAASAAGLLGYLLGPVL